MITGEGKFDGQTLEGKVVKGVLDRAIQKDKSVLVLSAIVEKQGSLPDGSKVNII